MTTDPNDTPLDTSDDLRHGPEYFIAETKSGLTMIYGDIITAGLHPAIANVPTTLDNHASFIPFKDTTEPEDGTNDFTIPLTWTISRIIDASGNYMDFIYDSDPNDGEHLLQEIRYTGNEVASLAAFNVVKFLYRDRDDITNVADKTSSYLSGTQMHMKKVIDTIEMQYREYSVSKLAWQYDLVFEASSQSSKVRLKSIVKSTVDIKLADTVFHWSEDNPSTVANMFSELENYLGDKRTQYEGEANNLWYSFAGDFDGNGISDIMLHQPGDSVNNEHKGANISYLHVYNELPGSTPTFTHVWNLYADDSILDRGRKLTPVDFNADGYTDLQVIRTNVNGDGDGGSQTHRYGHKDILTQDSHSNTHEILNPLKSVIGEYYQRYHFLPVDLNSDSLPELFLISKADGSVFIYKTVLSQYTNMPEGYILWSEQPFDAELVELGYDNDGRTYGQVQFGHLNSDGLIDIAFTWSKGSRKGEVLLFLNNGDGSFDLLQHGLSVANLEIYEDITIGDINADGLDDLVLYNKDNTENHAGIVGYLNTGIKNGLLSYKDAMIGGAKSVYEIPQFVGNDLDAFMLVDINFDGFADIYFQEKKGSLNGALINRIDEGFEYVPEIISTASIAFNYSVVDGYKKYKSPAKPYYKVAYKTLWKTGYPDAPVVADFNGDGVPDFLYSYTMLYDTGDSKNIDESFIETTLAFNKHSVPDFLVGVTNGLGVTTMIDYQPVTNPHVYVKGSGAKYPLTDIAGGQWVVSSVTKETGVPSGNADDPLTPIDESQALYRTEYTYSGARSHLRGRGFLGFQTFETFDPQTGIAKIDTLAHDWPRTGMVLESSTYWDDPEGSGIRRIISRTTNNVFWDEVQGGTVFPFVAASIEQKWSFDPEATNVDTDGLSAIGTFQPYITIVTQNRFDTQSEYLTIDDTQSVDGSGYSDGIMLNNDHGPSPASITQGNLTGTRILYLEPEATTQP
jgi:hypothetical protein